MAGGSIGGDGGVPLGGLALRGVAGNQSRFVVTPNAFDVVVLPTDGDLVQLFSSGRNLRGIQTAGWRPGYKVSLFLPPLTTIIDSDVTLGPTAWPFKLRGHASVGPTPFAYVATFVLFDFSIGGGSGLAWFEQGLP
jgi:hypothetical protein